MADISMCHGQNCPKKEQCYRFTASANPYMQSYANFDGYFNNDFNEKMIPEDCDDFWNNKRESL
ncbi:MAG: hypothetical protein QM489_00440 [Candidatus Izemoplasma sp.]